MKLFKNIIFSIIALLVLATSCYAVTTVTLAWDANTDPAVAGYKLYAGLSSRTYGPAIDVKNVTQYTLTNVPEGVNLYYAVTAYDSSGNESAYSVELPCFTLVPSATVNGVIVPSKAVVVSNITPQTFTITPAAGYTIKDVKVDATSKGVVKTYSFTNTTASHTISATFDIINPPGALRVSP